MPTFWMFWQSASQLAPAGVGRDQSQPTPPSAFGFGSARPWAHRSAQEHVFVSVQAGGPPSTVAGVTGGGAGAGVGHPWQQTMQVSVTT